MDLNIQIWLKTEIRDSTFPLIIGNKTWDEGQIVDFTSEHNFGKSRSTGMGKGWAIALQPNGSWAWNIGDGEKRLDYLPLSSRQQINDGKLHYLAFSVNFSSRTVWLYYDGMQVAVYSLDELHPEMLQTHYFLEHKYPNEGFKFSEIEIKKGILTPAQVASNWLKKFPSKNLSKNSLKEELFKVITWNIWHGGRKDGNEEGLEKTITVLKSSKADIICMQETYGSGPFIADRLGYIYYYRSTNLSVLSKYPIIETHGFADPFRFGGVTVQLNPQKKLRVFSLWINHLPKVTDYVFSKLSAEKYMKEEENTRGKEIKEILKTMQPFLAQRDSIPVVIGGDFNSPSHLDWSELALNLHDQRTFLWPVSVAMQQSGFYDAFRFYYPDPVLQYGRTWSPRFNDSWQDRIDYIYFSGKPLQVINAQMLDQHPMGWPSDHAAVLTTFSFSSN